MRKPEQLDTEASSARPLVYVIGLVVAIGFIFSLLRLLLPLLQVLAPITLAWWLWRRWQRAQKLQQDTLSTIFYQLLQEHQGRITVLDFAMTAKLPAGVAKDYLDARAKDFSAQFEVSDRGDIYYYFPTLNSLSASPSPQFQRSTTSIAFPANRLPGELPVAAEASERCLTQAQLARRLGVSPGVIRRKKLAPDLAEWSKTRDPEGVGWAYLAQDNRFVPGDR